MRSVSCTITIAMIMELLIGCGPSDEDPELRCPETMPFSSNLQLTTMSIVPGMKMSVVAARIRFAGGRPAAISLHRRSMVPGEKLGLRFRGHNTKLLPCALRMCGLECPHGEGS